MTPTFTPEDLTDLRNRYVAHLDKGIAEVLALGAGSDAHSKWFVGGLFANIDGSGGELFEALLDVLKPGEEHETPVDVCDVAIAAKERAQANIETKWEAAA